MSKEAIPVTTIKKDSQEKANNYSATHQIAQAKAIKSAAMQSRGRKISRATTQST